LGLHGDITAWVYLDSRSRSIHLNPTPSQDQGCVLVACILADPKRGLGKLPLWTIEFTDHALARVFHRLPSADLTAIVWDAHDNALQLSATALCGRMEAGDRQYRLLAGDGVFAFDLLPGNGEETSFIRATTWLHTDQLSERQELQIVLLGQPGDRLGESLLVLP
jgi:hypothetical protein